MAVAYNLRAIKWYLGPLLSPLLGYLHYRGLLFKDRCIWSLQKKRLHALSSRHWDGSCGAMSADGPLTRVQGSRNVRGEKWAPCGQSSPGFASRRPPGGEDSVCSGESQSQVRARGGTPGPAHLPVRGHATPQTPPLADRRSPAPRPGRSTSSPPATERSSPARPAAPCCSGPYSPEAATQGRGRRGNGRCSSTSGALAPASAIGPLEWARGVFFFFGFQFFYPLVYPPSFK